MKSHASDHAAKAILCRHSDLSTGDAAMRGTRSQAPGHGDRHHPHLAAGLSMVCTLYIAPPEDYSSCNSIKSTTSSNP